MIFTWVMQAATWVALFFNVRMNVRTRGRIAAQQRKWSQDLENLRQFCEVLDQANWKEKTDDHQN
jgi:hypothetical protein